jgi:hypothetical protein
MQKTIATTQHNNKHVNSNESEVTSEMDVSVTVIDDNIIYSTKSPELLKRKVVEVAPPTPPYEPSEYELKRLVNIKRINDYMEKKFPKKSKMKKKPRAKVSFIEKE